MGECGGVEDGDGNNDDDTNEVYDDDDDKDDDKTKLMNTLGKSMSRHKFEALDDWKF